MAAASGAATDAPRSGALPTRPTAAREGGALRPATAADAAAITVLLRELAQDGTLGVGPEAFDPAEQARLLAQLDLTRACMLVADVRGAVRGVGLAVRAPAPAAHTATVAVAVAAPWRRQGLGRLLLQGLGAWAAAAGIRKLCASVLASNTAALALFRAVGYGVEGQRPQQLQVGGALVDEILLGWPVAATDGAAP